MNRENSHDDRHPMDPKISLIICTTPRSGSSFLCEGIELAKIMGNPGEWLHPIALGETRRALDIGPAAPMDLVIRGTVERFTASNGVFALKLMWTQLVDVLAGLRNEDPSIVGLSGVELISRYFPDPHFVFLSRRELIAQAISYSRAFLSNRWLDYGQKFESTTPSEHEFNFCLLNDSLRSLRRDNRNWQRFLAAGNRPVLETEYEQILQSYRGVLESIGAFMGINQELSIDPARNRYKKMRDATSDRWAKEYQQTLLKIDEAESEGTIAQTPAEAFKAEIKLLEWPETVRPSEVFRVSLQICNRSNHVWPAVGKKDGSLWNSVTSYWYQGSKNVPVFYQIFSPLPCDLAPGKSAQINLTIIAPDRPGTYQMEISFAQTGVGHIRSPGGLSIDVRRNGSETDALRYFETQEVDPEGWIWTEWVGNIWIGNFPWIYSTRFGWLYCKDLPSEKDGYWFFRKDLGWFWTDPDAAPDVWSAEKQEWLRGELSGQDRERFLTPGSNTGEALGSE
jgi:LPS sulfotransferase NodH